MIHVIYHIYNSLLHMYDSYFNSIYRSKDYPEINNSFLPLIIFIVSLANGELFRMANESL